jgi:ketosteroid isomerase-like protein
MSRENVELVRGGFDAFQEGDLSQMLDLMADDLVTIDPTRMARPTTARRASSGPPPTGPKISASGR